MSASEAERSDPWSLVGAAVRMPFDEIVQVDTVPPGIGAATLGVNVVVESSVSASVVAEPLGGR